MLASFNDVKNMVVKWLTVAVGINLEQGLPVMNYNQEEQNFIVSHSGDIDVGGMFCNFLSHFKDIRMLGVRCYETCGDGTSAEQCEFWRFGRLPFGSK